MRADQEVTVTFTAKEARAFCEDVEALEAALGVYRVGRQEVREPAQVTRLRDLFRDMGLGVRGSYDATPAEEGRPLERREPGLGRTRLESPDGARSALVYLVAGGSPPAWRTRLERHPDDVPGWFGGRVLWGHDKPSEEEALELARAWVHRSGLPEVVSG